MSMKVQVFVGIGSNLSEPIKQVNQAIKTFQSFSEIEDVRASSLYRTKPLGGMVQPDYINAVVAFTTKLAPFDLLKHLQGMENTQGRVRTGERWSARIIDLDILLYGSQNIAEESLTIPHLGLTERNFVLLPLAELDPDLKLPDNRKITELLTLTAKQGIEKIE